MSYVPNSNLERKELLSSLGLSLVEELFKDISPKARLKGEISLPGPLSEPELLSFLRGASEKNTDLDHNVSFLGAGIYNHFIPSAVKHIISRSEFYTAYTPYQPEISQGILQAIFEYQSMICELTGMDVANASMYDGATAVAEAALLAVRAKNKKEIVVAKSVHPEYRAVLKTYLAGANLILKEIDFEKSGVIDPKNLPITDETACVIIQQPNFFGCLEKTNEMADAVHSKDALFIVIADPISLGLLKPPGKYGADIVVGEGQALGSQQSFGGPCLGIFAVKKELMRQIPGRIVGQTVDHNGKRGFVLTLQTREQHIRRERATSNICSNEALAALAATVYLSLMGKEGLKKVAELSLQKSAYLKKELLKIKGASLPFSSPTFKEFVIKLPISPKELNKKLLKEKIVGGLDLERFYPEMKNCMLLCTTELIRKEDVDRLLKVCAGL